MNYYETNEMELAWLELDEAPSYIDNPFSDVSYLEYIETPAEELLKVALDTTHLYFACRHFLNIEIFPYQLVALEALMNKRLPIFIANRGAAKSWLLAVYCLLKMALNPGYKIAIIGSGLRQARNIFDYMSNIWKNAPVLRDIAGKNTKTNPQGPKRQIDRFTFRLGDSVTDALPLGTGEQIRGMRANTIIADEFASIQEEIFNVVVIGFGAVASNVEERVKFTYKKEWLKKRGLWSQTIEESQKDQFSANQIIRSGTASFEFNHFYKTYAQFKSIIKNRGDLERITKDLGYTIETPEGFNWKDYVVIRLPYEHIAKGLLDEGIIAEAKNTLTRSQFLREFGSCFVKDSDGFFKRSVIESATATNKIYSPNGHEIQFTCTRQGSSNHRYVIAIDPAADRDNAAIVVLELHQDHKRIVYCWSTNMSRFKRISKYRSDRGGDIENNYYKFIAVKIRELMRTFNTVRIVIDKNGGGTSIAEALKEKSICAEDELPVFNREEMAEINEDGLFILNLVKPTNESNSEMNHAMLKDLETKALVFPAFDTVEMAKAAVLNIQEEMDYEEYVRIENEVSTIYDTYEDILNEIEELKNEMETIVVTKSQGGNEMFDVPSNKVGNTKKGRLRKDRYSALLYGNWIARNLDKELAQENTAHFYKNSGGVAGRDIFKAKDNAPAYFGRGVPRDKSIFKGARALKH
jgi:hypothetical protein